MIPPMKTLKFLFSVGVILTMLSGAAMAAGNQTVDAGARYHIQHSEFTDLPFGDGDLSYGIGYEISDENGMLQAICGFTPEFGDREDLDYGITPELNLLALDRYVQGGLGILTTYTRNGNGDDDWMDMYWQWILGFNIPLASQLSLQANAYYVFESWSKLHKFDVSDVEFGGYLGYKF